MSLSMPRMTTSKKMRKSKLTILQAILFRLLTTQLCFPITYSFFVLFDEILWRMRRN